MQDLSDIEFHDSSVVFFEKKNKHIIFHVEDIYIRDEMQKNVAIEFENIKINNNLASEKDYTMLGQFGSLLNICIDNKYAEIFIEWHDLNNRCSLYKNYGFCFENVKFKRY